MHVVGQNKHEYWNHFVADAFENNALPNGVTGRRLQQVKAHLWDDESFWDDIMWRHGGYDQTPERMRAHGPQNYEHCKGNFWGMIMQELVERRILPIR